MTAYNREAYVADAIESVLRSSFQDFELIVVDDSSNDGTVDIARKYERLDPRVRVYVNESNLGDYPNRNRAASYAAGRYLKYVDSDDVIYPHGLQVMVECMAAFSEAGFALSAAGDRDGPCPRFLKPEESYREHFFGADLFGRAPGSAIILRSAFESVGGFPGEPLVGDQQLWLKLGSKFGLVKMPRDLVWDRVHDRQESSYATPETVARRREVTVAALTQANCPLTGEERRAALSRVDDEHARQFWSLVSRRPGGMGPLTYKRRLALPSSLLARFAFRRMLRIAGLNPSRN